MRFSTASFDKFLESKSNAPPYNMVKSTRDGFRTKWLLFQVEHIQYWEDDVSRERSGGGFVLPTIAMSNEKVQEIIMDGSAYPLPDHYSEVVDSVDWLGRSIFPDWEQRLYSQWVHHFKNPEEIPPQCYINSAQFFYDSIELLINHILYNSLEDVDAVHHFREYWKGRFFFWHYHENDNFYWLVGESIELINNMHGLTLDMLKDCNEERAENGKTELEGVEGFCHFFLTNQSDVEERWEDEIELVSIVPRE